MSYKYIVGVLLSSIILLFSGCSTKEKNSFSISGKISNLNADHIILSQVQNLQKKTYKIVDSLAVNKLGEFNAVYFLEPNIYQLTINDKKLPLAINKGQNITINGSEINNLIVKGSKDTQLLKDYESFRRESLNRLVLSVRKEIKDIPKTAKNLAQINSLRELEVENYNKHLNELISFVKDNLETSIAVYHSSTRWTGGENLTYLQSLVSNFEEKHPSIEITQKLKNKLSLIEKTSIGSVISNINMPNRNNNIIALDSIKGKYTLVDFWASWCPPCRAESTLLNELYSNYKEQGFEIYGISLDSKKGSWVKALDKDKRIWPEVSTVEGFNTKTSIEYGITALPSNFLIDSNGKIIAVNIHGKKLNQKLKQLFN